jgi:glycine/D-amino acid oxidase-like deaminating enzyme
MPRSSIPTSHATQSWSTSSLWAEFLTSGQPRSAQPRQVDVLVVGAGLAGLLTATLLARSDASVQVLERAQVGGVATRNTTAKVSALQGTRYQAIRQVRGADAAAAYAAAQLHALDGIRQLIKALGSDCDPVDAPAYTYATQPEAAATLHEEHDAAVAAGLDVTLVADTELPFPVRGALRLDHQLHLNPGRLCSDLAAALPDDTIAEHTAVHAIEERSDGCSVTTADGRSWDADHVVLATQAPISDPALIANRCKPMQSYCLAARLGTAVPAGMYLSCDTATRSLRPARDAAGQVVAVISGAGHHMGDPAATPERWHDLTAWASAHFGPIEVAHRWATHDLVPTDHVPFIGPLTPRSRRRWVATGFAKWGMTNAYVAAHLLTAAIGGERAPWADTFDSTRIRASLNRQLVGLGHTAARHLVVDRVTRRSEPRCTHQGCVLRADTALGTWDCPCHGSRFGADGTPIQGPATTAIDVD